MHVSKPCLGQQSLAEACPICLHEPVVAEDCRPNKALRTTVKVFLRKKGIERDAALKKEMANKVAPPSSASPAPTHVNETSQTPAASAAFPAEPGAQHALESHENPEIAQSQKTQDLNTDGKSASYEAQHDIPKQSIEVSLH